MNILMKSTLAVIAACAAVLPSTAEAAVTICTSGPNPCTPIAPPANVGLNTPTTTGIVFFAGKTVTLANSLTVAAQTGAITFAAGTRLAADYFIFNPANANRNAVGAATFSYPVAALVRRFNNQGGAQGINSLSGLFAPTGTNVNLVNSSDLEGNDLTSITGIYDIDFDLRSPNNGPAMDVFMVLSAVPEPATWAMMIMGFGLIGGVLRRRPKATPSFA